MAVSEKERYEVVARQIAYHNDQIIDSFKRFAKLTVLIVAGWAWVLVHHLDADLKARLTFAARLAFSLVGIVSVITIIANVVAWRDYRIVESRLVGSSLAEPQFPKSYVTEIVMLLVIVVACIGAYCVLR